MITIDELKPILPNIEKSEIITAKDGQRYKLVRSDKGVEIFFETKLSGVFGKSKETMELEKQLH